MAHILLLRKACGDWLSAWWLLCTFVSLFPSPAPHTTPAAREAKVCCGVVLCLAEGDSCEGPGKEFLLTRCRCSWRRRGWSRRGETTSVWGMILKWCGEWSWSVGLQSSFHSCSGHCWSVADEQRDQVLFQCLGQNGLLSWFFFLECIVSLNFFHCCLSYSNCFPGSFSLFLISFKCYLHLRFSFWWKAAVVSKRYGSSWYLSIGRTMYH